MTDPHWLPAHPPEDLTWRAWVKRVAAELRRLSGAYGDWCEERAESLSECGLFGVARGCHHCGRPLDGAFAASPGGRGYCRTRSCPWCARRKAAKSHQFGKRLSAEPWAGDVAWYMLTITTARDVYDPRDGEVEALRNRLGQIRKGATKLVRRLRKKFGAVDAAMGVELSTAANGHVHAHMLLGLPLESRSVSSFSDNVRLADGSWGVHSYHAHGAREFWAEQLAACGLDPIYDCKPIDDLASAAPEILKYAVKAPDVSAWTTPRTVVCPELAARWEVASKGVRLRERWGRVRSLAWEDEQEASEPETVEDELCCECPNCRRSDFEPVRGRTLDLLAWYKSWNVDPLRGGGRTVAVDRWTAKPLADFRLGVQDRVGCRTGST